MLTDAETMVLASVQVFLAKYSHPKPVAFGSGFTINYLDRTFFISVSHVTDRKGLTTFLETNIPFDPNDGPILKTVDGICNIDLLNTAGVQTPEELEELLKSGKRKRLDISFAEFIPNGIPLLQQETDFGSFKVPFCEKLTLEMSHIAVPDKEERYGFYGQIRPQYSGINLKMTPTLKHSLKYHGIKDDFYIFVSPETIRTKKSFAGCSGAPILDSQQRLVAIACAVATPSRFIYGFPIQKCKQLLDYALNTNSL
jgi:hypothetical protein